jgi:small subunit ribosomal protein S10
MPALKEKVRIRMEGYEHRPLDESAASIIDVAKRTNSEVHGPIPLPTRIERYTVLASPHVDKKARRQFEIRTHARIIDIIEPTARTIEALNKLEMPAGVDIKIKVNPVKRKVIKSVSYKPPDRRHSAYVEEHRMAEDENAAERWYLRHTGSGEPAVRIARWAKLEVLVVSWYVRYSRNQIDQLASHLLKCRHRLADSRLLVGSNPRVQAQSSSADAHEPDKRNGTDEQLQEFLGNEPVADLADQIWNKTHEGTGLVLESSLGDFHYSNGFRPTPSSVCYTFASPDGIAFAKSFVEGITFLPEQREIVNFISAKLSR